MTTGAIFVINYFCKRDFTFASAGISAAGGHAKSAGATVAIFDLDGAVTRGDTYLAYLWYVLLRRRRRLPYCLGLPAAVLQFKRGRISNETLKCRFLAAILGSCSRTEIERHTSGFVEICETRLVKSVARARVDWHRKEGHRLVLASASLDVYVLALGARLGFDDVVCTRAAWEAGAIAGRLAGPNLLGEAKLVALKNALALDEEDRRGMFAYSDHHADLSLLLFAKHGRRGRPDPGPCRRGRGPRPAGRALARIAHLERCAVIWLGLPRSRMFELSTSFTRTIVRGRPFLSILLFDSVLVVLVASIGFNSLRIANELGYQLFKSDSDQIVLDGILHARQTGRPSLLGFYSRPKMDPKEAQQLAYRPSIPTIQTENSLLTRPSSVYKA